ncbi:MAG: helix-turn-helix transcriptional regulator [Clostridia bacterium]|nr:helix-turn-helix transcriptional regulator [Clostridia bacterium]
MNVVERKEYIYSNHTGDAIMTAYEVFPGVELVFNSVHMNQFNRGEGNVGNYIEIHHCREGRIEQEFGEENLYLMPGDLSVAIRKQSMDAYSFPLHHYHGITIAINTDIMPRSFSEFLGDVLVEPLAVAGKLCGDNQFFVLRGEKYIEHIFSELYSAPEKGRIGYFKVKIMELFLILNELDLRQGEAPAHSVPRSKVALAKRVAEHLAEHMDEHITIPELAKQFGVSGTHLQNAFKSVYGVPVYAYIRIQKMQAAAERLINSDCSILQIASEFGYDNSSKFTAAFREIMGESPRDYRRLHSKLETE